MRNERRGLQGIRTMGALVDNRRARTPGGALLELSALANERVLLERELARGQRRRVEIEARLAEIGAKEEKLMVLVPRLRAEPRDGTEAARAPLPDLRPGKPIRTKELRY